MAESGTKDEHLERLAETAVEHLKVIRKHTAWIAFVVVLTFALSVIGVILIVATSGSSNTVDLCTEFPHLC
jgi:hypothetical protein